jgi:hypothetical protein
VIVTTGRRREFGGFGLFEGIFVVAPLGVVSLASLLRVHLIELHRARITGDKRAEIAARLLDYIASPQFKSSVGTSTKPSPGTVRRYRGISVWCLKGRRSSL